MNTAVMFSRASDQWSTPQALFPLEAEFAFALDCAACGKCWESTLGDEGSWALGACPGWYPGLTVMQLTAETIAARAMFSQLADRRVEMKLF